MLNQKLFTSHVKIVENLGFFWIPDFESRK